MRDEEYGWQEVRRRRNDRRSNHAILPDVAMAFKSRREDNAKYKTYFFSNFPENHGAQAMLNIFRKYGKVVKVVIPAKRDKGGRRFGFARFDQVRDVRRWRKATRGMISMAEIHIGNGGDLHSGDRSYAHVVQGGKLSTQRKHNMIPCCSYDTGKEILQTLNKMYVGEVIQEGTTYNIQEAFHRQGYFGVKVTPLGANLTLLEEQDEGELHVLMVEAKCWVYGITVHDFFSLITKPIGKFVNANDVTSKKLTMDVARIMIRTREQKVVDEFLEVEINNEFFHLRMIEDSYGPMRIMVAPISNSDGRDDESNSSEEDVAIPVEEEDDGEVNAADNNLLALTNFDNVNNEVREEFGNSGERSNAEEIIMETANILNLDENSNIRPVIFNEDYREDFQERVGLDRQSDADPTGLDTTADRGKGGLDNNNQVRKGLGRNFKSNGAFKDNNEGNVNTKGDVISFINRPKHGGPTRDQSTNRSMSGNFLDNTNSSEGNSDSSRTISNPLTQKMETGRPIQRSFQPPLAKKQLKDVVTKEACNRNLLGRHKAVNNKSDSTSSAGSIIGCSSLKSIEIKNCNKQHQNRNEEEVTNKVWKGVVSLGVEGDDIDSIYKRRITVNERKDIEAKNMREHKKQIGERKGSSSTSRQSDRWEFTQFVEGMDVVDVPVTGKKFTWFSFDGKAMSRLDRFLLSEGFIVKGRISGQWFNNCWMDHDEFKPFVEKVWNNLSINGKKAFVIKEKLKRLKEELKIWNKEVFGILDLNIEKTVKELNDVEGLLASDMTVANWIDKGGLQKGFWDQLHHKESLLKQKSRMKWALDGDANSRYFHASLKGRRRRNQLVSIKKDEVWIQGVDNIKKKVKQHFSLNFLEEWTDRPFLSGIDFNVLSQEDNWYLMEPFTEEEVREVMDFLLELHHSAVLPKA
ncbi:cysteine-rich receptor-like protein kinase, partial [Trifolium pratense]